MKDQADTLRKMMRERAGGPSDTETASRAPCRIVTVASGKGGVGKSCLVANLGALIARSGLRVLLVDADFGLANLDILMNVQPRAHLEEILAGSASIQEAVIGIEPNLWLLPAASGIVSARKLSYTDRMRVASVLAACPWEMDLILVDAGSGIQENVLSLHGPIQDSLVVLTPEPTSLTDAYGLIKLVRRERGVSRLGVIVNQVTEAQEAIRTFKKLNDVADRFIDVELEYLGHCTRDENFPHSVMNRKILLDWNREASAVPCLELLAKRLIQRAGFEPSPKEKPVMLSGARGMTFSRFREEPVRVAPGNTARFWKILLGEVKA